MSRLIELPQFVREAFEGDERDEREPEVWALAEALERGAAAQLDPLAPSAESFSRLLAAVARPPGRYAPFCARLAKLFDLSEEAVLGELTRLAEPGVWRFAGLPGIQQVPVRGGSAVAHAETLFVRFAPGTRFPRHQHTGDEHVLVLEGDYTDSAGVVHRPGELREWPAGSEHSFRVSRDGPCIFASVVFGRRFSAPPLRLLARMLGR